MSKMNEFVGKLVVIFPGYFTKEVEQWVKTIEPLVNIFFDLRRFVSL